MASWALLRSNPRLGEDAETGALKGDQEELMEQSFEDGMKELGRIAWDLNMHYVQLIHWAPFDRNQGAEPPAGGDVEDRAPQP